MPFEYIKGMNLQIPQTNYHPIEIQPRPNYKALAAIEALSALPALIQKFSPEERLKRQVQEQELKVNSLKYSYLLQHPELFSGKSATDTATIAHLNAETAKLNRENQPEATFKGQEPAHWNLDKVAPTTEKPYNETLPDLPPNPFNSSMIDLSQPQDFPTTQPEDYWT